MRRPAGEIRTSAIERRRIRSSTVTGRWGGAGAVARHRSPAHATRTGFMAQKLRSAAAADKRDPLLGAQRDDMRVLRNWLLVSGSAASFKRLMFPRSALKGYRFDDRP